MCQMKSCRKERKVGFMRFSVPNTEHKRVVEGFIRAYEGWLKGQVARERVDVGLLWLKEHRGRIYPS
jgi:hypothetical protein